MAVAADQIVILRVAVEDVVAGAAIHDVVTRFAMDLVGGADVADHHRSGLANVVGTARGVVDQRDAARHDVDLLNRRQRVRVVVVVERQEAVGRGHTTAAGGRAIDADETVDVAVVADDRVGVVGVSLRRAVAGVVAARARARATEDEIGSVRPARRCGRTEQTRAAADDVVLAVVAEQDVATAATLDVVVAVGCRFERGADVEVARRVAERADTAAAADEVDRAVALDYVVAELTEDRVVVGAACDVVIAVKRRGRGGVVMLQGDLEVRPLRRSSRVRVVGTHIDEQLARGRRRDAVDLRARQGAEARIAEVVERRPAVEGRAVAEQQVAAGAAVDRVGTRAADDHVIVSAGVDGVVAANRRIGGRDGDHDAAGVLKGRVVADDEVVAGARVDHVGAVAANHQITAAKRRDGVVAAVTGLDRLEHADRQRMARPRIHDARRVGHQLAAVAEHHVVAGARVNRVAEASAQDDVLASARGDVVDAAVRGGRGAGEKTQPAVVRVDDLAVVAENDVIAGAAVDRVVGMTTDEDVVATQRGNRVVAAVAMLGRFDRPVGQQVRRRVHRRSQRGGRQATAVAEHHVVARARRDGVAGAAAQDDVVTVAGGDAVDPAVQGRRRARDVGQPAVGGVHELAVVAEDGVVAVAGVDRVVGVAAQHDILAAERRDLVVAAIAVLKRLDRAHRERDSGPQLVRASQIGHDAAAVANRQVISGTRENVVVGPAAQHHVVAGTERDRVRAAARLRRQAGDRGDATIRGFVDDLAVVAEDDVAVVAGDDDVAARAAEHDVAARPAVDLVVAARFEALRLDEDHVRRAVEVLGERLRHEAEVADEEVVALAAEQVVVPAEQRIGPGSCAAVGCIHNHHVTHVNRARGRAPDVVRFGNRYRRHVHVEARIAIDDVIAGKAVDGVVSGTAGELIAKRAAGDGVGAAPAEDGHRAVGGAGVDDVVTGVRELPRLARQLAVALRAGVARAVLFGVPEDHQWRIRAATAVDRNGVAAAAAMHDRQRTAIAVHGIVHRRLDRQRIVAGAEHDLERFDVLVGDAAGDLDATAQR